MRQRRIQKVARGKRERSLWSCFINDVRPEGAREASARIFNARSITGIFQTLHVWLPSQRRSRGLKRNF
jgi:hypothetical protein